MEYMLADIGMDTGNLTTFKVNLICKAFYGNLSKRFDVDTDGGPEAKGRWAHGIAAQMKAMCIHDREETFFEKDTHCARCCFNAVQVAIGVAKYTSQKY